MPPFTDIEKNNCFSIYTRSDLNNICSRKQPKADSIDISIHALKTCKRYKALTQKVFTEASIMASLKIIPSLTFSSPTSKMVI